MCSFIVAGPIVACWVNDPALPFSEGEATHTGFVGCGGEGGAKTWLHFPLGVYVWLLPFPTGVI